MQHNKTNMEYSAIPGTLETSGFRKTSDDFTFTIASPKREQAHVTEMLKNLSCYGVFFFFPCSPSEAESILSKKKSAPVAEIGSGEQQIVDIPPADLETLSEWLTPEGLPPMTERNVQLLEAKGIVIRVARGRYDLKRSVRRRIGELSDKGEGKDSDMHREKVEGLRLNRQIREANFLERMGKLVNAEEIRTAIEKAKSEERQSILNMPKNLAPRLEGLSGTEIEVELNKWSERHLSAMTAVKINNETSKSENKKPIGRKSGGSKK